jgi:GDP-4-dehydro-6-deoxy-D-mannose reductase
MRVLITGGTGFVGTHLIRLLEPARCQISVLSSHAPSARQPDVEYHQVDIRDRAKVESVVREIKPHQIYHLAGITSVEASWVDPRLTFEVNVLGAHSLFDAAMNLPIAPRILNVSTSQVYDSAAARLTEQSPVSPSNPYAASKAMAELLAPLYKNRSTRGIITARPFNHTGSGQLPNFVLSSIAKQFAEIEMGMRPPKLSLGNINVKRDFTDVRDVVRAYNMLLADEGPSGVYNVCSGVAVGLYDIVQMFQSISGIHAAIEMDSEKVRPDEIPEICGDPRKLEKDTGWRREIPIDKSVEDLLSYWRSQMSESMRVEKHSGS